MSNERSHDPSPIPAWARDFTARVEKNVGDAIGVIHRIEESMEDSPQQSVSDDTSQVAASRGRLRLVAAGD